MAADGIVVSLDVSKEKLATVFRAVKAGLAWLESRREKLCKFLETWKVVSFLRIGSSVGLVKCP